ncbi:MAG: hypothetical protein ACI9QC_000658, partial [Oceanicoccus sp.]
LNDEIFGGDHSKTDTFMAKVHKFLDENMKDSMLPIHFSVKGGFLLVESWTDNEARDEILKTFEQKVNEILVGYLSELSKEDEEHYRAMLDKYCKTPVRFSYGSADWPEGDLDMEGAAQTIALTTGMLKLAISRRGGRRSPDHEDESTRRVEVLSLTTSEYIEKLKKGLQMSFGRALAVYSYAKAHENEAKLKAFAVKPGDPVSSFILLGSEAFSALRKGQFDHSILDGFTQEEKHTLNAYRKAVNSLDVLTAYTKDTQEGYFEGVKYLVDRIHHEDVEAMKQLARVSHKDPVLHERKGRVTEVDEHCIVTKAELAKVFSDVAETENSQIICLDLIAFGYLNHIALAELVPQILKAKTKEEVLDLLSCPLDKANIQLNRFRREIKVLIGETGLIEGDGGDELTIYKWGGGEWNTTELAGLLIRSAGFTIDGVILAENRMTALAQILELGDREHAQIKLGISQNPVRQAFPKPQS